MSRILITGASGFLGRNLVDLLTADGADEILAVARHDGPSAPHVAWHPADLLVPGTASRLISELRPQIVYHLAWCATPGVFWTSPENEQWVSATRELAGAIAKRPGTKLVAAGTCAEYDWMGSSTLVENVSPFAPATLYGKAKHATQASLAELARTSGLYYAWLRIFWLYGRYEHPARLVPGIVKGLLAGEEVPLTEGRQRIDMLAASDVARAFIAAGRSSLAGAADIASGHSISVREVAEAIATRFGRSHLLKLGARPTLPGTPAEIRGVATRLIREAGWQPSVTLDEGLRIAIDDWSRR